MYWFDAKRHLIKTWATFKIVFQKIFTLAEILSQKWKRIRSRKPGKFESVMCYFYEKIDICNKLELHFSETKEELLSDLFYKDIAMSLTLKGHTETDELLQDILNAKN